MLLFLVDWWGLLTHKHKGYSTGTAKYIADFCADIVQRVDFDN